MVLRGRTHHRWATDVDLIDNGIALCTRLHGLHEWVEVHDDELKWFNLHRIELTLVRDESQVGKQTGMDARVQSLYATIERFGKPGYFRDFDNRDAGFCDGLGGRTGRDNFDTVGS